MTMHESQDPYHRIGRGLIGTVVMIMLLWQFLLVTEGTVSSAPLKGFALLFLIAWVFQPYWWIGLGWLEEELIEKYHDWRGVSD